MRFYERAVMALVANGVTTATQAISLANFVPRIENLPQSCQSVYTTQIAGCQASDFPTPDKPQQTCSSSCVNGLVKITQDVANGCQSVNVPDDSIIGVFLLGRGIPSLCPGVEVTTVAPSSTTSQAQQSSTSAEVTSTSEEASSTSSTAIAVDTSVPTEAATTLATSVAFTPNQPAASTNIAAASSSSASSAKASQTASSQKSNSDSGGGSPFDVQATGASSTLRSLATGSLLGLVAIVFATL